MDITQMMQLIIAILVALGGFSAWVHRRIEKRFDSVDESLKDLNTRISRIEGYVGIFDRPTPYHKKKNGHGGK